MILEAQLPGTTQDHLQIFNIEMKAKLKSYQMPEQVNLFSEFLYFHFLKFNDTYGVYVIATIVPDFSNTVTLFIGCFLEVDHPKDVGPSYTDLCLPLVN